MNTLTLPHLALPRLALPRLVLITATLLFALPLTAQTVDHSAHTTTGTETPATLAFIAANAKMHTDMAIPYTTNPDADFLRGMIPHHQGAVDMARIILEHGTDPEVKAFAQTIIAAQEAEIAWMTAWLAKNGG